ncbi:MAG: tetratricopeptide repeat protein [Planctomycetales bacterium]|nr:tetratricopeptide repeat protein [Planctomycetales bacterium]
MKSERRHQLEKNELADRLAWGIESARSYLPIVLGGVALLALGSIGWGLYSSSARKKASAAWTEFYFQLIGSDADTYLDIADDYPRSAAAGWAQQIAGDLYLQRGVEALYRNKGEGKELLAQAIEAYEQADKTAHTPDLRSKALLGLAQAHESLGEIDKAIGYYQQLAKTAPQAAVINEANERLAFLSSDSGKDFYGWFTKLDPKPDAPIDMPSNLMPPGSPDIQFGPTTDLGNLGAALNLGEGASPPTSSSTEVDPSGLPALPGGDIVVPPAAPPSDEAPADAENSASPEPTTGSESTPESEAPAESSAAADGLQLEPSPQ